MGGQTLDSGGSSSRRQQHSCAPGKPLALVCTRVPVGQALQSQQPKAQTVLCSTSLLSGRRLLAEDAKEGLQCAQRLSPGHAAHVGDDACEGSEG